MTKCESGPASLVPPIPLEELPPYMSKRKYYIITILTANCAGCGVRGVVMNIYMYMYNVFMF